MERERGLRMHATDELGSGRGGPLSLHPNVFPMHTVRVPSAFLCTPYASQGLKLRENSKESTGLGTRMGKSS